MKPKVYKLNAAIELVAKHGYTQPCVREYELDANPLVRITQDWWPCGREVAHFERTRGKYKGNRVGFALRPKEGERA